MTDSPKLTRRETLILGLAATSALSAGTALADDAAQAQAQAKGTVFVDRDGTGRPSAANPGLAGALVSNGREVAVTDASGHWSLPAPSPCVFFVVKPAGYMPPVDLQTNLPRFYYLHSPGRLAPRNST